MGVWSFVSAKGFNSLATLTAVKFNDPNQADNVLHILQDLQSQQLIQIQDAAIVRWPSDAKKPKTQHLSDMTGVGALGGAFWGLLFGLLFFVPFLGLAIGAGMGALFGHMAKGGIDENFINQVKAKVTPGTSALFLLTTNVVEDRVVSALQGIDLEIVATNLSAEEEEQLREAFAEG